MKATLREAVAKRLKMELVTVWVKPDDVRDGLKSLIRLVGEPLADPAWIPAALLARRAAQDVKLALVGEGADELFGGYPTYIGAGLAERFARLAGLAQVGHPAHGGSVAAQRKEGDDFVPAQTIRAGRGTERHGAAPALGFQHSAGAAAAAGGGADGPGRPRHGRRRTAGPGAALGFGDAAGRGVVDQGRPREHEFGAGTARAVPGRSGDGICEIASGRGPGAGIQNEGFSEALCPALPAGRTS